MKKITAEINEYLDYCEKIRQMSKITLLNKQCILTKFVRDTQIDTVKNLTNHIYNSWLRQEFAAIGSSQTATWTPAGESEPHTSAVSSLLADNDPEGDHDYVEIVTGTATSGNVSNWAFKVDQLAGVEHDEAAIVTTPTDYNNFSAIPSETAATIVNGVAPVSMQLKTQYQVYTAPTQAGGTYKGQVTYTVVDGA